MYTGCKYFNKIKKYILYIFFFFPRFRFHITKSDWRYWISAVLSDWENFLWIEILMSFVLTLFRGRIWNQFRCTIVVFICAFPYPAISIQDGTRVNSTFLVWFKYFGRFRFLKRNFWALMEGVWVERICYIYSSINGDFMS